MTTLESLREDIDAVDAKIIAALAERMKTVKKIGEYKRAIGVMPFDSARFEKVLLARRAEAEKHGLSAAFVEKLYRSIHEYALSLEEK